MHYERFAPSPTGKLHLGHAFSSLLVYNSTKKNNGKFLLRIEDLDFQRCRREFEESIFEDLNWLGIKWDKKPIRQSQRFNLYTDVIKILWKKGVAYKCECTRKDISKAFHNFDKNQSLSPDIYPGTCRTKSINHDNFSVRLDIRKAIELIDKKDLFFFNKSEINTPFEKINISPETLIRDFGDVVIARKDIKTSYHIAVVVDDSAQKISQVTRGYDLFKSTFFHVLLQKLLNFKTPKYLHHKILYDDDGKKLSKRIGSTSLETFRNSGARKEDLVKLLNLGQNVWS